MAKKHYFTRYLIIVRRLQQLNYAGFLEIQEYLAQRLLELNDFAPDTETKISRRTLQRDIKDIYQIFGVDIQYCHRNRGYYIHDLGFHTPLFDRLAESFEIIATLQMGKEVLPFVFLENRKPSGTEYLMPLLKAIREEKKVDFIYRKFTGEPEKERNVIPCGLKEFHSRWYLIAIDLEDSILKSFGLDRMRRVQLYGKAELRKDRQEISEHYRNSFGIISPADGEPNTVLLKFSPQQTPYIKTLPLHESQQIVEESNEGCLVKLEVHLSHDFLMELLSFGDSLTVLKPKKLRQQIQRTLQNALENYQNH